jgi:hypothetical protein
VLVPGRTLKASRYTDAAFQRLPVVLNAPYWGIPLARFEPSNSLQLTGWSSRMRQPLRFYFFHVYIAQESRFGCPESLHTTSWIVRLDSVDKIPPSGSVRNVFVPWGSTYTNLKPPKQRSRRRQPHLPRSCCVIVPVRPSSSGCSEPDKKKQP